MIRVPTYDCGVAVISLTTRLIQNAENSIREMVFLSANHNFSLTIFTLHGNNIVRFVNVPKGYLHRYADEWYRQRNFSLLLVFVCVYVTVCH